MGDVAAFSTITGDGVEPELVALLENLLHRAKAGRLKAMAYAVVNNDRSLGTGWAGAAGSRHLISSSIMILNARYPAALREDEP